VKDRTLTMAQFAALEEQAAWHEKAPQRRRRREKQDSERVANRAVFEAQVREMGLPLKRGYCKREVFFGFQVDVNDELTVEVSHRGSYCYAMLARRGAFRGRFTSAEVVQIIAALRAVRLPARRPHKSRAKPAQLNRRLFGPQRGGDA
jgi:hypothetical protein